MSYTKGASAPFFITRKGEAMKVFTIAETVNPDGTSEITPMGNVSINEAVDMLMRAAIILAKNEGRQEYERQLKELGENPDKKE